MKKIISLTLCSVLILIVLTGCTNQGIGAEGEKPEVVNTTENIEVNQNDYRGSVMRVEAIKANIINLMGSFNERNMSIVTENPSSYWESDAYKYLSLNFINDELTTPTSFFNETETDWATVEDATMGQYVDAEGNMLVQNYLLVREDENRYRMSFTANGLYPWYQNQTATFDNEFKVIYDANHDWSKVTRTREESYGTSPLVTDGFFEYARLGSNSFAIQTETERLYVVYESTLYDEANNSELLTNPLKEKNIIYFCYSRLDGNVLPKYMSVTIDENTGKPIFSYGNDIDNSVDVDEEGNYVRQYNPCDSMFYNVDTLDGSWVLEQNGLFNQVLVYENEVLTVKTLNELSNKMEYTIFNTDGSTVSGIEEKPTLEEILSDKIAEAQGLPVGEDVPTATEEQPPVVYDYENASSELYSLNCLTGQREILVVSDLGKIIKVGGKTKSISAVVESLINPTENYNVETDINKVGTLLAIEKETVTVSSLVDGNAIITKFANSDNSITLSDIKIGDKRADIDARLETTSSADRVTYQSVNGIVYVNYLDNEVVYVSTFAQ